MRAPKVIQRITVEYWKGTGTATYQRSVRVNGCCNSDFLHISRMMRIARLGMICSFVPYALSSTLKTSMSTSPRHTYEPLVSVYSTFFAQKTHLRLRAFYISARLGQSWLVMLLLPASSLRSSVLVETILFVVLMLFSLFFIAEVRFVMRWLHGTCLLASSYKYLTSFMK